MSDNTVVNNYGGIGFFGALFLVFLVLKLTGIIAWSWWWVTAPLWMPAAIAVVILLFLAVIATIMELHSK